MRLFTTREDFYGCRLPDIHLLPTIEDGIVVLEDQILKEELSDKRVSLHSISMDYDDAAVRDNHNPHTVYSYSYHALRQIASIIRPADATGFSRYLQLCPPPLRSINFNHWLQEYKLHRRNKELVLRVADSSSRYQSIRGVVSTSYTTADDIDLVKSLSRFTTNQTYLHCLRGDIISRYDVYLDESNPSQHGNIILGVRLINSEVGASAVKILPLIGVFGHECLIRTKSVENTAIRHVGHNVSDKIEEAYKIAVQEARAFRDYLCQMGRSFITVEQFNAWIERHAPSHQSILQHSVNKDDRCSREYFFEYMLAVAGAQSIAVAEELQFVAHRFITDPNVC